MAALWGMFDGAVRVLVGAGPVKQRLIEAWRDHLATLHEKDIPEALRSRLAAVRTAMHAAPATGGITAPEVSVRKMSDKDAAEHAVRILEMYAQLCSMTRTGCSAAPARRRRRRSRRDLPAFLSRA